MSRDFSRGRLDLYQYYIMLLRRKWLVLAVVLTVTAAATLQAYTTTPLFTAVVRLQIDPENLNLLPYEDPFQTPFHFLAAETYLRTQAEILRSRALAKRLVTRLNLLEDPIFNARVRSGLVSELTASASESVRSFLTWAPPKETPGLVSTTEREDALADAFRGSIGVDPIRGTRLMELSYTSHDPDFAARVVNELTTQFLELTFERKVTTTNVAGKFLDENLEELRSKVEESERRMQSYARENDIIDLDKDSQDIVVQRLVALTAQATAAEAEKLAAGSRYESIQESGGDDFPTALKTPEILRLESSLASLNQEQARLSATFREGWPELRQKQNEVAAVEQQLKEAKHEAREQVRQEYEEAARLYGKLQAAVEEQKTRANQLFAASIQYNILKREAESNKVLYQSLLQRSKQAEISASLRSSNIQVVDEARPPGFASSPNKRRTILFGVLLGLMLGVGLGLAMEYLDNTVKTPDDLMEFMGLPTLSVIPRLDTFPETKPALESSVGQGGESVLVRYLDFHRNHMWEAYRALRTSILLSHSEGPPRTILVTSALPGEGKTTTALHTAMVLAQTGKRTVLIDLDLRKPTVARLAGLDGSRGMTNYLSGNARLATQLQPSGVPNLFVVPSGPHPPNPAELIGSSKMSSALALLRDYVDFVVLDSPPLLSVSDALILANMVDGVVLVIEGGRTPREAVRKASDRLVSVGGRILGALINNVDVSKSEYAYYYRYYYYYDDYYRNPASQTRGATES